MAFKCYYCRLLLPDHCRARQDRYGGICASCPWTSKATIFLPATLNGRACYRAVLATGRVIYVDAATLSSVRHLTWRETENGVVVVKWVPHELLETSKPRQVRRTLAQHILGEHDGELRVVHRDGDRNNFMRDNIQLVSRGTFLRSIHLLGIMRLGRWWCVQVLRRDRKVRLCYDTLGEARYALAGLMDFGATASVMRPDTAEFSCNATQKRAIWADVQRVVV